MHIFCLDYTVSVSKSYPLRVQNKLTTSGDVGHKPPSSSTTHQACLVDTPALVGRNGFRRL